MPLRIPARLRSIAREALCTYLFLPSPLPPNRVDTLLEVKHNHQGIILYFLDLMMDIVFRSLQQARKWYSGTFNRQHDTQVSQQIGTNCGTGIVSVVKEVQHI